MTRNEYEIAAARLAESQRELVEENARLGAELGQLRQSHEEFEDRYARATIERDVARKAAAETADTADELEHQNAELRAELADLKKALQTPEEQGPALGSEARARRWPRNQGPAAFQVVACPACGAVWDYEVAAVDAEGAGL